MYGVPRRGNASESRGIWTRDTTSEVRVWATECLGWLIARFQRLRCGWKRAMHSARRCRAGGAFGIEYASWPSTMKWSGTGSRLGHVGRRCEGTRERTCGRAVWAVPATIAAIVARFREAFSPEG